MPVSEELYAELRRHFPEEQRTELAEELARIRENRIEIPIERTTGITMPEEQVFQGRKSILCGSRAM